MSGAPDWSRLEAAVSQAAERLRSAHEENQRLRETVARLEGELEQARRESAAAPAGEVARRLAELESEIESLLG